MFQTHDHVVHPRHGVGTITEMRTIDLDGQQKRYYCITLMKNHSVVMVSADHLAESGLRPATMDPALIREIMVTAPENLPDNNRERENKLKKLMEDTGPRAVLCLLRDLEWHEHRHRLTAADRRFRDRARELIANELALHSDTNTEAAHNLLQTIIEEEISSQEVEADQNA